MLNEALSSEPLRIAEDRAELEPAADDTLQRNVEEALDHASE